MFQSTSRCARILVMHFSFPSKHALDLFLIKTCLFSLTTCKAVTFLTSAVFFGYLNNFKTSVLSNILIIPWDPAVVFLYLKTQEKWKLAQQYFDSWSCCQPSSAHVDELVGGWKERNTELPGKSELIYLRTKKSPGQPDLVGRHCTFWVHSSDGLAAIIYLILFWYSTNFLLNSHYWIQ